MTTRVPLAALDPQERAAQCPAICQASVMARQANGRKVFSADTRATLEAAFARFSTDGPSFVLSKARIAELEQQTSESAERIRKWFDNRRIKETKNRRAAIAEAFMASQPAAAAAPPAAAAAGAHAGGVPPRLRARAAAAPPPTGQSAGLGVDSCCCCRLTRSTRSERRGSLTCRSVSHSTPRAGEVFT